MSIIRKMIQCATRVNRNAVKRMVIDGIEHVVVSSYTLPDNIVMNGGLYPADEISASFSSLERTLAPIEHPTDAAGNYISANDPVAIHNFHAGAFNVNVTRENGRVHIEKYINVQEAMKSERGRRLMDRITELETNEDARPIHTSTGVFCEVELVEKPQVNNAGQEYTWIARNMVFDHDAILLDNVGAAQPSQGVGMAVNKSGLEVEVDQVFYEANRVSAARNLPLADSGRRWDSAAAIKRVRAKIGAEDAPNSTYGRYHLWYDSANSSEFGAYKLPFVDIIGGKAYAVPAALRNAAARLSQTQGPSGAEKTRIQSIIDGYLEKLKANSEQSFDEREQSVREALTKAAIRFSYIEKMYEDHVIFWDNETDVMFTVPYVIDEQGITTIVGIPLVVERNVTYTPKTNSEGDAMRELMLKALADAGITVNAEISDDDLLAKYNELQANQSEDDGQPAGGDLAQVVANAVKPLSDKIDGLESKLNAADTAERDRLVAVVVNSGKYPELDEEAAKVLPVETLKKMAGNCGTAHGLPLFNNAGAEGPNFGGPEQMPE